MMHLRRFVHAGAASGALLASFSCGTDAETEAPPATTETEVGPGFGSEADVAEATRLYRRLDRENYEEWPLLPGTVAQQRGQSPHGYYVTRVHDGNLEKIGDGVTLAKLNFDPDGNYAALTVMSRRDGYDPDNDDWFYAKFLPDGSLDLTADDEPLAGAIEPEPGAGCRGCHRNALGKDFMFWNDAAPP